MKACQNIARKFPVDINLITGLFGFKNASNYQKVRRPHLEPVSNVRSVDIVKIPSIYVL